MAESRPVVYCIVPGELAAKLHKPLREFFRDDSRVQVVVERRQTERRRWGDRRRLRVAQPAGRERRRVRSERGRRVDDRRATAAPADPPELPAAALPYRNWITFVERLEPSTLEREDADTARLIARLQAGEDAVFDHLYERYFDRVYSYLAVTLGDADDIEDVSQEVFTRVLEAIPRYERRAAPFRAWLFRIVRNTAVSRLRERHRLSVESPDEIGRRQDDVNDLSQDVSERWIEDRSVVALVAELPPVQRQVIVLRYMLGMSPSEIAVVLGRSPAAVRQLQHRAMLFMRSRLDPPDAPNPKGAALRRVPPETRYR
jgi:RNA polymerase sigma-70 factor (ECF subfamily)